MEQHPWRQRYGFGRGKRTSTLVSQSTDMGDLTTALWAPCLRPKPDDGHTLIWHAPEGSA